MPKIKAKTTKSSSGNLREATNQISSGNLADATREVNPRSKEELTGGNRGIGGSWPFGVRVRHADMIRWNRKIRNLGPF